MTRSVVDDQFGRLLEAAPDALVVVDDGGRIVLVNRQTERLFGYTRDALLGQPVEVLLPERFRAHHRELRHGFFYHPALRAMGRGWELWGRRADGSEFPVEVNLGPLPSDTGTLVTASVRDVTGRTPVDERTRTLATVAESSDDAMIIVDLDGTVTVWNRGAELTYGYSSDEAVGRPIELLANRFRYQELPAVLARVANGERVEPFETKGVRKDGSVLDASIRVSPVCDADGTLVAALIVVRDISETVSFRDRLAVALYELSRQTAELARRNHHLALINVMAELLGRADSEAEAYDIAGKLGSRLFHDVSGGIFALDADGGALDVVASWGEPGSDAMFAAEQCWAVRGNEVWEWPRGAGTARCGHVHANVVASHCVPLLDHRQAIGVVSLTTTIPQRLQAWFDETDEALAETFSENLAMVLANVRLREKLEAQVRGPRPAD